MEVVQVDWKRSWGQCGWGGTAHGGSVVGMGGVINVICSTRACLTKLGFADGVHVIVPIVDDTSHA